MELMKQNAPKYLNSSDCHGLAAAAEDGVVVVDAEGVDEMAADDTGAAGDIAEEPFAG